ncbi:GNAT family N-acetyltransferase [Thiocapsa sp.]|uniref:GNAT family N-acetyltransferase n=1 Tax=Thiocapsa sp. TaxID=2024551 RepID=UPI002C3BD77E|nr:GNAT family N-acetyltransferase [Thiocapsa sp.]HSO84399.1 GNAT family N-acetyltransferase [Thiocapsa sp.]
METDIGIRIMSPAEVDLAIEWAAREGWNPGLDDAACFRAADPEGFLMAFVDGEPAASLSAVRYGETFGFIGLYIAAPLYRGRGIALRLWQAGMAYLGDRVIGLDGVPERQHDYRRSGFELAWRNVRYSGTVALAAPDDPSLVPVDPDLLPALLDYDRRHFPAPRDRFLEAWLTQADTRRSWAFVEPEVGTGGGSGRVTGYGTVRQCRAGWKIGPLFADDAARADLLFRRLAACAGTDPVILDLPEPNPAALDLAKGYGLCPVFETARMYRGAAPTLPIDRIYGVTTFELG